MQKTPPPPQPTAQPPRPGPPAESSAIVLGEMEATLLKLKRHAAAFSALRWAHLSAVGRLPPGERQRGLPVFEFSAPLEGREKVEPVKCVIDLKNVDPQYIEHVLVPIINAEAVAVHEAAAALSALLTQFSSAVAAENAA